MMFCKNCGTRLDEGTKFCTKCGAKLEGTGAAAQPAPQQGAWQQTAYAGAPAQKKNAWQYFAGAFKKYAVFQGRARRAEYWWYVLFNSIITYALAFIGGAISGAIYYDIEGTLGTVFYSIASLVFLLPSLGVGIRRMHDLGKSGWYMLIPIYAIVLAATAGEYGPNRFGPDPKQET